MNTRDAMEKETFSLFKPDDMLSMVRGVNTTSWYWSLRPKEVGILLKVKRLCVWHILSRNIAFLSLAHTYNNLL